MPHILGMVKFVEFVNSPHFSTISENMFDNTTLETEIW